MSQKTCKDCKYFKCGVDTCFCRNFINELSVPRLIRNPPERPIWCPKEDEEE